MTRALAHSERLVTPAQPVCEPFRLCVLDGRESSLRHVGKIARILVAVAGSFLPRPVIDTAAWLAALGPAEVILLAVREREFTRGVIWEAPAPGDLAELMNPAIYALGRQGVRARGAIRMAQAGRVAEEIVYAAREQQADFIVMGSHGRSRLRALVFGSVSQRVMQLTHIPVLMVPVRGPGKSTEVSPGSAQRNLSHTQ